MERIHVSNTKNTPEEHMEMIYVSNVNNRMLAMLLHIISRDVFFKLLEQDVLKFHYQTRML